MLVLVLVPEEELLVDPASDGHFAQSCEGLCFIIIFPNGIGLPIIKFHCGRMKLHQVVLQTCIIFVEAEYCICIMTRRITSMCTL